MGSPCPGMPASIQPGDPEQVRDLFERIAPSYDRLNDLLSLGLHRLWKRQAVAWLQPRPGQRLLDLCCGTGDLALLLAQQVRPGGLVKFCNLSITSCYISGKRHNYQFQVQTYCRTALTMGRHSVRC